MHRLATIIRRHMIERIADRVFDDIIEGRLRDGDFAILDGVVDKRLASPGEPDAPAGRDVVSTVARKF